MDFMILLPETQKGDSSILNFGGNLSYIMRIILI